MNILQETWFWVLMIAAPIITVAGILARLARREDAAKYAHFAHSHPTENTQNQSQNQTDQATTSFHQP